MASGNTFISAVLVRIANVISYQHAIQVLAVILILCAAGSLGFIAHAADGDFAWVAQVGGSSDEFGRAMAVDNSGNVYTSGWFQGTVDFDPGAGTTDLTASNVDIFVSKTDSAGSLVWVRQLGGSSADRAYSVAVDASGNVYTAGNFLGTADFDPGAGTVSLTAVGSSDVFVSKLDSAGDFVWAKQLGGSGLEFCFSLAVDSSDNILTTGRFNGTTDFDPGAGTSNLTSLGGFDVFVSKLDSDGDFVWAKQLGGTTDEVGYAVTVDSNDNVYSTGSFSGTSDFDPSAGSVDLTAQGGNDIFVSKLDSSGAYVRADQLGGTSNEVGYALALDSGDNVCAAGYFQGTVDFDPGASTADLAATGGSDIFVCKLDSSGGFVWANKMSGSNNEECFSLTLDEGDNVYLGGYFKGTVDFDPSAGTSHLTAVGSSDIFVAKLDNAGGFGWAKKMGGSNDEECWAIAVDSGSNFFATGYFQGTVDFDPGSGTSNLTASSSDIFLVSLSGPPVPPSVVSVTRADSSPTNAASVGYTVAFDQDVTEVGAADFELVVSGISGASVSDVTGSGDSYSVTVDTGSGEGTLRLDVVDDDSVVNGSSQPLGGAGVGNGGFNTGESYDIDNVGPTVGLSSIITGTTNAPAIAVDVTLSEASSDFDEVDIVLTNATISDFGGSGNSYSFTLTANGEGLFSASVAAAMLHDALGNANSASNTLSWTFDTTPPGPPNLTGSTPTNNVMPTWSWTAGGGGNGTFRYELDSSGTWTETTDEMFTPITALSEGPHTLLVQERDDANNWSTISSFDIVVDITAPNSPSVSGTTPTNDVTPTWTWNSGGGGGNAIFRYDLDSSGTWTETPDSSFVPTTALNEAVHHLEVQERDDAGNWSVDGFFDITVDVTPPAVSVDDAITVDNTPALSGIIDDGSAVISVTVNFQTLAATNNGATWSVADNLLTALPYGTYDVEVTATDDAGNVGIDATTNELIIEEPVTGTEGQIVANLPVEFWKEGIPLMLMAPDGWGYEWRKNGVPLSEDAPRLTGIHEQNLMLNPQLTNDAGIYTVRYDNGAAKALVQTEQFVFTVSANLEDEELPATSLLGLTFLVLVIIVVGKRIRRGWPRSLR